MPRHLVIQLARFGDLLQSGRLIHSLLARGETHVCVDRSLAALAGLVYPQAIVHPLLAHGTSGGGQSGLLDANRRSLALLAKTDFDAVYNLNHSGLNRALARLFDPSVVCGHAVRNGQNLRTRWLDLAFRWTLHRRSAPLNLVDVWASLLADPLPPEACNPVAVPGGRGLGIVLAGRESRRSLPPEVLAPCTHALFEALGGPDVHVFGSEAERPLSRRLIRHLPAKVIERTRDHVGRTSWADLHEGLTGLDLVFSPDTGVMHLAACVGTPVQAVFLSSAWAWETGPYGLGHRVWQADAACAPCLETAPCLAGGESAPQCLAPFRSSGFLNALAGRRPLPEDAGIWPLDSRLDALGLDWIKPSSFMDEHGRQRLAQRALLAEYRGRDDLNSDDNPPDGSILGEIAHTFYQEADWMLPDPLP
ncbi:MAG: glycosyltransferase family 9 protein [Deltaproteobacteria bacterium]|jgi:ADP-heptose:LPS heptosyltransferase|nr:glycosyltransferase family 9 protein [Deltaproteobacteria bacterium]